MPTKGGKSKISKIKEIRIPVKILKEEKERIAKVSAKKKVPAKKVKINKEIRIAKDKNNLPVLEGVTFKKAKAISAKKVSKEERASVSPVKPIKKESNVPKIAIKKDKKIKLKDDFQLETKRSSRSKEKILYISVIVVACIIFFAWVAIAKDNIFSEFNKINENSFVNKEEVGNGLNSFLERLDKIGAEWEKVNNSGINSLEEGINDSSVNSATDMGEQTSSAPPEDSATNEVEDGSENGDVISKVKEKILTEELINKIEEEVQTEEK